jgi:hypothetical protein
MARIFGSLPVGGARRLPWMLVVALTVAPFALLWSGFVEHLLWRGDRFLIRDFINDWQGARLFLEHRTAVLFTPALYAQSMQQAFGSRLPPFVSFSYPPSLLPLIGWLGLLPCGPALALWTVLGVLALFAAAWPHSRNPWVAAAILVSPPVLACIDDGQNGLFTSALIVAALARLDRRPVLAGVFIGLLTIKPHLGLLLPVALIAARRWRVVASAAVTALLLFALSLALAGPEAWSLYLAKTAPYQGVLYQQIHRSWATMTPSPAIATVVAGGSWTAAFVVQGAATLAAMALVGVRFAGRARRPIDELDRVVLVAATFVASPYSFNYDMGAVAACLLMANLARPELDRSAAWRCGSALLWSAPLVMVVIGVHGLVAGQAWPPVGALMVVSGLGLVLAATGEGSLPRWARPLVARLAAVVPKRRTA